MPKGPNQLNERVPIEVGTSQVNFCKNPQCRNFGIPASTKRQPTGRRAAELAERERADRAIHEWGQRDMTIRMLKSRIEKLEKLINCKVSEITGQ